MAIEIQRPGVAAALQRFFRYTGSYKPVLSGDILPVVNVGDASGAVEPQVIRRVTAIISVGATAGQLFTGRFESIGSTICRLRRLFLHSVVANQNLRWAFRGAQASIVALASVSTKSYTDGRLLAGSGAVELPSGVLTIGTQVAPLAGTHGQIRLAAEGTMLDLGGWVVGTGGPGVPFDPVTGAGGGGFWEFQISVVNSITLGFLEWDEHPIV